MTSSFRYAALFAALAMVGTVQAQSLDRKFLDSVPQVLEFLQKEGCKNVGVLKFRAKKGNEPATDNVGPLNMNLANRLQVALVLKNPIQKEKQLNIIKDASAVAAQIKGTNHLNEDGRQKLFAATYPLAWGNEKVKPDAFVTGWAAIKPDMREMTVSIQICQLKGNTEVARFTVKTDPQTLINAGQSFALRSANFGPNTKLAPEEVVEEVSKTQPPAKEVPKEAPKESPKEEPKPKAPEPTPPVLASGALPVELEIYYDGQRIPIEAKDGKAQIPDPQTGQRVEFVLRRKDSSPDAFGVVLMLNGENTLFKQKLPLVQCRRWILSPDDPPVRITGFRIENSTEEEAFRVLTPEESKKDEINYGADVGTISMTVFRASKEAPPRASETREQKEEKVVAVAQLPKTPPANPDAAKGQLLGTGDGLQGLIVGGERREGGELRVVDFRPDPTPIASLTVAYYHKQDLPPK